MRLITWNVQWCRGVDGLVSPERIVAAAQSLGPFDVLCLQEVACGFDALPGSSGEDQFQRLAELLPEYTAVPGYAVDLPAAQGRKRFGNLVLSRYPVTSVLRHQLPWPADPYNKGMARLMIEATVEAPWGPLRILTTHLEYYSALQRMAQAEAIAALHAQACRRAAAPGVADASQRPLQSVPQTCSAILTGDLNFRSNEPEYAVLCAAPGEGVTRWVDAWAHRSPGVPQPHTHALYDKGGKPESYACDFIFVTEDLAGRVRRVHVDQALQASDHQPMVLDLEPESPR
jgi:endonuclease/exonuclease/phosphatase family metal-dependent hydrolase